jgi:hypothetical protein
MDFPSSLVILYVRFPQVYITHSKSDSLYAHMRTDVQNSDRRTNSIWKYTVSFPARNIPLSVSVVQRLSRCHTDYAPLLRINLNAALSSRDVMHYWMTYEGDCECWILKNRLIPNLFNDALSTVQVKKRKMIELFWCIWKDVELGFRSLG